MFLLGGDPTGTGKGGASIYGRTFPDEIHEDLKHTGNGTVLFFQNLNNSAESWIIVITK